MMRRPPFFTGPSLKRAVTIGLNAFTTRPPGASASRANASAPAPAPIVPNFMLSLSVSREIDQNDTGAAGPADMRHRVGDPGGWIALGNLEQRRRLARQAQCERDVGFALLRRL